MSRLPSFLSYLSGAAKAVQILVKAAVGTANGAAKDYVLFVNGVVRHGLSWFGVALIDFASEHKEISIVKIGPLQRIGETGTGFCDQSSPLANV